MIESRLVALARQAQNLQPERRTNTLSELRGRWSDYVNPYQTPPQQLSDLANPLRWPAMAVEGIQTAVETVPRMLQPGYDYSNTRQAAEDAFNVAGVVGAGSLLGTAAKPANAVGTFGGKLGGAASELDMSQAARMARAKEMGFDTDQVWYHGTDKEFDAFDLGQVGANHDYSIGVHLTNEAPEAASYGGNVLELMTKAENPLVVDAPRWNASVTADSDRLYLFNEARKNGHDAIIIKGRDGNNNFISLRPENIRSVNAAFDPAKADSTNLLASRGAPVPVEQRRRRDKDEIF